MSAQPSGSRHQRDTRWGTHVLGSLLLLIVSASVVTLRQVAKVALAVPDAP